MVEQLVLPPLREELGLFPAPATVDGTPAWTLHDPPANKFFLLGWSAFEVLTRWSHGTVASIVEAVNRETTLSISDEDVLGVVAFLEHNFLLQSTTPFGSQRLLKARAASRPGWAKWLLNNYLFIRIPVVKPERFLAFIRPCTELFFTPSFFLLTSILSLLVFVMISRQWDAFVHSFTTYRSLEGILTVGCSIAGAKVIHELGHAITAHRYGCRIPTMGIALVVMTPMLYTDTNEAWKLKSRAERLAIGVAGIAAESLLALAALWVWLVLPPGPLRAASFILATTTWIMTITLNASPFMRFDGYFILSDYLRIPNLHQRSFAFGRWWLRELLFGLGVSPPERLPFRLKSFLIFFALTVWIYRLVVFLGIAVLVYHYFFKVLGIVLFAVELGWFIAFPLFSEVASWWKLRVSILRRRGAIRSLLLLAAVSYVLFVPWKSTISVPAALSAVREQQISAPVASKIISEIRGEMQKVHAGEVLLRLDSHEMNQQISQAATSADVYRWQADQQSFDEKLLSQGNVLQRRLEAGTAELTGLNDIRNGLILRAPFDGTIVVSNDELTRGVWLHRKEPLYVIADTSKNRVDAFVNERELKQVKVGSPVRFIPDALEFGVFNCTVSEIDHANIPLIDETFLASTYGGPIASIIDSQGMAVPESPLFHIRIDGCSPSSVPLIKLRGVAIIEGEKRNLVTETFRHLYALVIREVGF